MPNDDKTYQQSYSPVNADEERDMAAKGGSELSKFADKAKEATSAVKETKESWQ